MNENSQETLRLIEEDDPSLTSLSIVKWEEQRPYCPGRFYSEDNNDFNTLGVAIGKNTHIKELVVNNETILDITHNGFYEGIHRNESINDLVFHCGTRNLIGGIQHKVLTSRQRHTKDLASLYINAAVLHNDNEGLQFIATTLRCCISLKNLTLYCCDITDELLLPIVEAIRGCNTLERLDLDQNRIRTCEALASLLSDPNSNLQTLQIQHNSIREEGVINLANSLVNNTKLQTINIFGNSNQINSTEDVFSRLLCNTSSINDTFSSNHTLEDAFGAVSDGSDNAVLLHLNRGKDKIHVAMKKILRYHPNIDIEPLFKLNIDDDERNLKGLPYVINWFDKAGLAVADNRDGHHYEHYDYNIHERKLSAIYEFVMAMPHMFVPVATRAKVDNKKRKRRK